MELVERILNARNLTQASREVIRNKGAAGIDRMSVKELKDYLDNNRENLMEQIHKGEYIPQPIRGKTIPKGNGKTRLLGIPTVVDRMLQQAVMRVIMPKYEYEFSTYSYGFRPQRNTHQAVAKVVTIRKSRLSKHCRDRPKRLLRRSRPRTVATVTLS